MSEDVTIATITISKALTDGVREDAHVVEVVLFPLRPLVLAVALAVMLGVLELRHATEAHVHDPGGRDVWDGEPVLVPPVGRIRGRHQTKASGTYLLQIQGPCVEVGKSLRGLKQSLVIPLRQLIEDFGRFLKVYRREGSADVIDLPR